MLSEILRINKKSNLFNAMLRYLDNVENKRQINENLSQGTRIIYLSNCNYSEEINGAKGQQV
jgi:hypothetical protein